MDAESILRPKRVKRKKRKRFTSAPQNYDLRPLIIELKRLPSPKNTNLIYMHLTAREGATGRPDEVLAEMDIPVEAAHVERIMLRFKT
jgi:hypothetical protein